MKAQPVWYCKYFETLTPSELYDILRLRNEVFVVEQQCIFQDADNVDKNCHHFFGISEGNLAAYCRLMAPGIVYSEASIGRVVASPLYRGQQVGKQLFSRALQQCNTLFGDVPVKIGAQLYLKKFYESFGFTQVGEEYLEDGIPHIHMILIS